MDRTLPTQLLPVSQLLARKRTHLRFAPDAEQRARIAEALDLQALPAFTFEGEVTPEGRGDLALEGVVTADAVQSCIVTLAPVPARLRERVARRYLADWVEPEAEESEIPEDDSAEPLPHQIDVAAVAIEALALALPEYPRAPGAALGEADFPAPDTQAEEEAPKPLAGLAALLARKSETP